jgi:hypothetical protein
MLQRRCRRFTLALARRVLAVLIAAAVALAPVGASAAARGLPAKAASHAAHTMHHDHGAMHAMASEKKSEPCAHKTGRKCCCDDKSACAQTCLQKCFGNLAVLPPERASQKLLAFRLAPRPAERPPGWASAPQLPPPRV